MFLQALRGDPINEVSIYSSVLESTITEFWFHPSEAFQRWDRPGSWHTGLGSGPGCSTQMRMQHKKGCFLRAELQPWKSTGLGAEKGKINYF